MCLRADKVALGERFDQSEVNRRGEIVGAPDRPRCAGSQSWKKHFIPPKDDVVAPVVQARAFGEVHEVLVRELDPGKVRNYRLRSAKKIRRRQAHPGH